MKLNEILGIDYPIIQGGMANISDGEFAASVSNAGALGVIGGGAMSPERLRAEIKKCKSLTHKPFAVNLMLMHPKIDELAELVVEEGVKILTTGAGNPSKYIERWKENGIKIFPVVSSSTLGERMEKMGVDGLIAEGMEAGGHIGEMTTMTLLPELASKVKIPVIAAGGIASGKQMLAAKVLGAVGVQMGTAFLATEECRIHSNYKEKIINAKENHIIVIGKSGGLPVRLIRNTMTNEYIKREKMGEDPLELEKFTLGRLRKAVEEGDTKEGSLMAGIVASQIKEILRVEDLLKKLSGDYKEELAKLNV